MRHSFFGGVTPAPNKENTRRKPIARPEGYPERVILPVLMCADDTAEPLVKVGDTVTVGQPVACGTAGIPVHASVSGRVAAIEEHPHPWGGSGLAVVVENDGQDTPWPDAPEPIAPDRVTLDLLVERVRQAGVVGMGGGAYPTAEKLRAAAGKIDTLIVNAAECEPYVTADHRLLLERSERILQTGQVLARVLGAKRVTLVADGDKLNAVEHLERKLRRGSGKIDVCAVHARYPLGAERQVIQTVTGREVPPGKTPLDVMCLVLNVATVFAIQQALFQGRVLTHRTVTVAGGAVARPRNLWVPIGTPMSFLVETAGGLKEQADLVLTGGPMMGTPQSDLSAPVVKNTNAVIFLTARERRGTTEESVCIRCGKCVAACPMHLAPAFIDRALRLDEVHKLVKLHPEDCLQCGCCSYICPARIPLLERVSQAYERLEEGGFLK